MARPIMDNILSLWQTGKCVTKEVGYIGSGLIDDKLYANYRLESLSLKWALRCLMFFSIAT